MVFFQGVQDGRGVAVFIAGVKGQVEHFFVGLVSVPGVELF